uniref:Uncharacterized protein n=1 Tax=Biomphalaria glabrata TaxID=6526 RepID=A0A2C9KHX4_BIOGL
MSVQNILNRRSIKEKLVEPPLEQQRDNAGRLNVSGNRSQSDDDNFKSANILSAGRKQLEHPDPAAFVATVGKQSQTIQKEIPHEQYFDWNRLQDKEIQSNRCHVTTSQLSGKSSSSMSTSIRGSITLTAEEATVALLQGDFSGGVSSTRPGVKTCFQRVNKGIKKYDYEAVIRPQEMTAGKAFGCGKGNKKDALHTGKTIQQYTTKSTTNGKTSVVLQAVHSYINLTNDPLVSQESTPENTPSYDPLSKTVKKRNETSTRLHSHNPRSHQVYQKSKISVASNASKKQKCHVGDEKVNRSELNSNPLLSPYKVYVTSPTDAQQCNHVRQTRMEQTDNKYKMKMAKKRKRSFSREDVCIEGVREAVDICADPKVYRLPSHAQDNSPMRQVNAGYSISMRSKTNVRIPKSGGEHCTQPNKGSGDIARPPVREQWHCFNALRKINQATPNRPVISRSQSLLNRKKNFKANRSSIRTSNKHQAPNFIAARNVSSNMNPLSPDSPRYSDRRAARFHAFPVTSVRQGAQHTIVNPTQLRQVIDERHLRDSRLPGDVTNKAKGKVSNSAQRKNGRNVSDDPFSMNSTRFDVSSLNNPIGDSIFPTQGRSNLCKSRKLCPKDKSIVARDSPPFNTTLKGKRSNSKRAEKVYYFHYDSDNESCDVDLKVAREGSFHEEEDFLSVKVNPGNSSSQLISHLSSPHYRSNKVRAKPVIISHIRLSSSSSSFSDVEPEIVKQSDLGANFKHNLHLQQLDSTSDDVSWVHTGRPKENVMVKKSKIPLPIKPNLQQVKGQWGTKPPAKPAYKGHKYETLRHTRVSTVHPNRSSALSNSYGAAVKNASPSTQQKIFRTVKAQQRDVPSISRSPVRRSHQKLNKVTLRNERFSTIPEMSEDNLAVIGDNSSECTVVEEPKPKQKDNERVKQKTKNVNEDQLLHAEDKVLANVRNSAKLGDRRNVIVKPPLRKTMSFRQEPPSVRDKKGDNSVHYFGAKAEVQKRKQDYDKVEQGRAKDRHELGILEDNLRHMISKSDKTITPFSSTIETIKQPTVVNESTTNVSIPPKLHEALSHPESTNPAHCQSPAANSVTNTNVTMKSSIQSDYFPITCVTYKDYYSMSEKNSPMASDVISPSKIKLTTPHSVTSNSTTCFPPTKLNLRASSNLSFNVRIRSKTASQGVTRGQLPLGPGNNQKNVDTILSKTSHSAQFDQKGNKTRGDLGKGRKVVNVPLSPQRPVLQCSHSKSSLSSFECISIAKPEEASEIMAGLRDTLLSRRQKSFNTKKSPKDNFKRKKLSRTGAGEQILDTFNISNHDSLQHQNAHDAFKNVPIPIFESSLSKISTSDNESARTLSHCSNISRKRCSWIPSNNFETEIKSHKMQRVQSPVSMNKSPTPRKLLKDMESSEKHVVGHYKNAHRKWDSKCPKKGVDENFDAWLTANAHSKIEKTPEHTPPPHKNALGPRAGNVNVALESVPRHLLGNVDELREKYLKEMLSKDIYEQLSIDVSPAGYRKSIIDHYQFEMMSLNSQSRKPVADKKPTYYKRVSPSIGQDADINEKTSRDSIKRDEMENTVNLKSFKTELSPVSKRPLCFNDYVRSEPTHNSYVNYHDAEKQVLKINNYQQPEESPPASLKRYNQMSPILRSEYGVTEVHFDGSTRDYRLINDVSSLLRASPYELGDEETFGSLQKYIATSQKAIAESTCNVGVVRGQDCDNKLDAFIGAICNRAKLYIAKTNHRVKENEPSHKRPMVVENIRAIEANKVYLDNEARDSQQIIDNSKNKICSYLKQPYKSSNQINASINIASILIKDNGRLLETDELTPNNIESEQLSRLALTKSPVPKKDDIKPAWRTESSPSRLVPKKENVQVSRDENEDLEFWTDTGEPHCKAEQTRRINLKENPAVIQAIRQANNEEQKRSGECQLSCVQTPTNQPNKDQNHIKIPSESKKLNQIESSRNDSTDAVDFDRYRRSLRRVEFRGRGNNKYVTSALRYTRSKFENQGCFQSQAQKKTECFSALEKNNSANFRPMVGRNSCQEGLSDIPNYCFKCSDGMNEAIGCLHNVNCNTNKLQNTPGMCLGDEHDGMTLTVDEKSLLTRHHDSQARKDKNTQPSHDGTSDNYSSQAKTKRRKEARRIHSVQPGACYSSSDCSRERNPDVNSQQNISAGAHVSFDWYKPSASLNGQKGMASDDTQQSAPTSSRNEYCVKSYEQPMLGQAKVSKANNYATSASGRSKCAKNDQFIQEEQCAAKRDIRPSLNVSNGRHSVHSRDLGQVPHERNHLNLVHEKKPESYLNRNECSWLVDSPKKKSQFPRETPNNKPLYRDLLEIYNKANQTFHNNWLLKKNHERDERNDAKEAPKDGVKSNHFGQCQQADYASGYKGNNRNSQCEINGLLGQGKLNENDRQCSYLVRGNVHRSQRDNYLRQYNGKNSASLWKQDCTICHCLVDECRCQSQQDDNMSKSQHDFESESEDDCVIEDDSVIESLDGVKGICRQDEYTSPFPNFYRIENQQEDFIRQCQLNNDESLSHDQQDLYSRHCRDEDVRQCHQDEYTNECQNDYLGQGHRVDCVSKGHQDVYTSECQSDYLSKSHRVDCVSKSHQDKYTSECQNEQESQQDVCIRRHAKTNHRSQHDVIIPLEQNPRSRQLVSTAYQLQGACICETSSEWYSSPD